LPGVTNSPSWVRYIVRQHDNEYTPVLREEHSLSMKEVAGFVTMLCFNVFGDVRAAITLFGT
jgi:hypothetical protein